METLTQMKCVACSKDAPTLTDAEIAEFHRHLASWEIVALDGIKRPGRARLGCPVRFGRVIRAITQLYRA
jgi:hypothetical protein